MNRLWVRISVTYIAILFFIILIPMIVILSFHSLDPAVEGQFRARIIEVISTMSGVNIVSRTLRFLFLFSILGTLAGIITSHNLLTPLNELAEAAQAIGSRDLSQRLDIKGTVEIQEVTRAFNSMAAELEKQEQIRRNLLADVAHELRTPITVIQGNMRAILDGVYEMDQVELARLYDQTRQLSRLVDDLHELAQVEANLLQLETQDVNLIELVNNLVLMYQPLLEEDQVQINLDLPDAAPIIQGDQARLTQCVSNLLNNACRYTPSGGEISVSLEQANGWIQLSVKDTGIGIPPEHLPHIFERFYRVDPARNRATGGTGLGLAITKALVEAHQGEITAVSAGEERGSDFIIKLPVAPSEQIQETGSRI